MEAAYYYQTLGNIMVTRGEKFLYIIVNLPIHSMEGNLNLFKIDTMPIPVNNSHHDFTLIKDITEFIALTNDNSHFAEVSTSFINSCSGTKALTCPQVLSLRPVSHPTCAVALYLDRPKDVTELCPIAFENTVMQEQALDAGDGKFAITTSVSQWTLFCGDDSPQIQPACSFCIISLRCGCRLSTPFWSIAARINNCQNTEMVQLHSVNLLAAHLLYPDAEVLHKLSGASVFHQEQQVRIPDFNISADDWKNIAENDRKFSQNFKTIVKNINSEQKTFTSKSDYLSRKMKLRNFNADVQINSTSWITYLSIGLSLINFLLIVLSCILMNKRLSFMPMFPGVGGMTIHNTTFMLEPFTIEPLPTPSDESTYTLLEIGVAILVMIGLLCCAGKIIKTLKQKLTNFCYFGYSPLPKSILYMDVLGSGKMVSIKIAQFACAPPNINKENFTELKSITINGSCIFPAMLIDWGNSILTSNDDTGHLNSVISLPILKGFHLRRMLRREYRINYCLTYQGERTDLIPIPYTPPPYHSNRVI